MKMIYNGVPVQSMKVSHYEMNTNSATVQPSDMQAGVTCFARGQKITGTGKSFSFATYGRMWTNDPWPIPGQINTIEIASLDYPIQMNIAMTDMHTIDLSSEQIIGSVIVDNMEYPISVTTSDNLLIFSCEQKICLQVFYGKDEYV